MKRFGTWPRRHGLHQQRQHAHRPQQQPGGLHGSGEEEESIKKIHVHRPPIPLQADTMLIFQLFAAELF